MRKCRWFACFLLVISMLCAACFSAFASETETPQSETPQSETAATETETETEPVIKVKVVKKSGGSFLVNKATGEAVKGLKGAQEYPEGSGNFYYFLNKKGKIAVKKWIKNGKKIYYAQKNGKLPAGGIKRIAKKYYFFNPKTRAAVTGWKKIDGLPRYFNAQGVQQFGFLRLKHTYYLDPDNGGGKVYGWQKISGKWYYFETSKGRMQRGFLNQGGQLYYLAPNGIRASGLTMVGDDLYFFNNKQGGAAARGWVTKKKKTYYFGSNCKAVKGWLEQSGSKYYFNESSCVMAKGWTTLDGKKYYFDKSTGVMATGKQTIDGKTYDFGTKGYIVEAAPTGPWSIKVNQGTCVVTVYRGSTAVKAMLCSPGVGGATPNGSFTLGVKRHWHALFGNVYGQYTSHITGNILFHSVYYYRYKDNNSLSTEQYNKLGTPASAGCVRLNCADAYYIYSQVPVGTPVTIFTGTAANDPLPRPAALRITTSYDPTDPIKND